jgi:hypothetical protein
LSEENRSSRVDALLSSCQRQIVGSTAKPKVPTGSVTVWNAQCEIQGEFVAETFCA